MNLISAHLDPASRVPLYIQLHDHLAFEISSGGIREHERLPGRRQAAKLLGVSLSTVDSAYQLLASEGYIISHPRSGFTACRIEPLSPPVISESPDASAPPETPSSPLCSFETGGMDTSLFPFKTWGRLFKDALYNRPDLLNRGDPCGDADLRELHELGVDRLYLGIESGLDDALRLMNKDHTLAQAYEQIDRLHESGINYGAHIMTGVAGKGRGIENAEATAEFLSRTAPQAVINFSMFVHRSSPLYKLIESGEFAPASELENLIEDRRLLELLKTDGLDFDGFHDYIEFRVRGRLPDDRQKMLDKLDAEIEKQRCTGLDKEISWSR